MLTAQELDLLAAERARRGLTIPLDQVLLWASLMMDLGGGRGPVRLMSNNDALIKSIRAPFADQPDRYIAQTQKEATPSAVFADYLEESGIPGAHIVRQHAAAPIDFMQFALRPWTHDSNNFILGPRPEAAVPMPRNSDFARRFNPGWPLLRGTVDPENHRYALRIAHMPNEGPAMNGAVTHGAIATNWEELLHLISDFPSWSKKAIVQHAVRAFGKPGKPNVRKLAREPQPQFQRTSQYVPLGLAGGSTTRAEPVSKAGERLIGEKAGQVSERPTSFMHLLDFSDRLLEAAPNHPAAHALEYWLRTGDPSMVKAHFASNPTDPVSMQVRRALSTRPMKLARWQSTAGAKQFEAPLRAQYEQRVFQHRPDDAEQSPLLDSLADELEKRNDLRAPIVRSRIPSTVDKPSMFKRLFHAATLLPKPTPLVQNRDLWKRLWDHVRTNIPAADNVPSRYREQLSPILKSYAPLERQEKMPNGMTRLSNPLPDETRALSHPDGGITVVSLFLNPGKTDALVHAATHLPGGPVMHTLFSRPEYHAWLRAMEPNERAGLQFKHPAMQEPMKLSRDRLAAHVRAPGTVTLYHFADPSMAGQDSFVTDPSRLGQNKWSHAERKATGFPRTMFYVDLADKEGWFGGKPMFTAEYPADRIYDAAADPEGHVAAGGHVNDLLTRLRNAGYHGLFYSGSFPTVAMWEPVTVHKADERPVKLARGEGTTYPANQRAQAVAKAYHDKNASALRLPVWTDTASTLAIDPHLSRLAGAAYESMKHGPADPRVRAAYTQFKKELLAQYDHAVASGMRPEPSGPNGYDFRSMHDDLLRNNHMWYQPTAVTGFGEGKEALDHPMLEMSPHGIPYNDLFRVVHDYYGHAPHGHDFSATGELRAWQEHARMFSPLARRALTNETHGQNSWVHFGPHLRGTETADEKPYAEQKAGLLPKAVWPRTGEQ